MQTWASAPRTGVYLICARNVRHTGRAGSSRAQVDFFADAFGDPRLERTIQGINRDHNEPERRFRTPLIRPHLLSILHHLQAPNYDNIVLWAAFTLAFAGFLPIREFTYREADKELGNSFPQWFLTKKSIQVAGDGAHMELTIPASKTDPFRKGITLTIAATLDEGCPVQAMKQLQATDTHRSAHVLLFCIGKHKQQAFTWEYVVQRLQYLATIVGLGQGRWNEHSFRRGAATWAAQVGITEAEIQTLGRWRSYAYKVYIEYTREEHIALSRRFQYHRATRS